MLEQLHETAAPSHQPTEKTAPTMEIGGRALLPVDLPSVHSTDNPRFRDLFPAFIVDPNRLLDETISVDGAKRLADELHDDDPYKDFAYRNIALYYLHEADNPDQAYDIVSQLHNESDAVEVLSQIIMYQDDHSVTTPQNAILKQELHTRAIEAYNTLRDTRAAQVLGEASEALPEDSELRHLAKEARIEHPEVIPVIGDDI